jgi:hypothetical protein
VVEEELGGVAGLGGLLGREEALLHGRDLVEAVAVGVLRGAPERARNVSLALVLCNREVHGTKVGLLFRGRSNEERS